MERYRISAERTGYGWKLESKAFDIVVDAGPDGLDDAIGAMKKLMAKEAAARLERGEFLPAEDALDPNGNGLAIYVETDFEATFVKQSETVRRNISVPAWIDLRLRRNNIDGSRLFQDAALAKLAEMEATGRGLKKIQSLDDLHVACAPEVLDEYFGERASRMLEQALAGEQKKGRN